MIGKNDNSTENGMQQLKVYDPEETKKTLIVRNGKYYMRTLYYDWKHTGSPHSFTIPVPGGDSIIFNITYFAWGATNANRWALIGGASSPMCKADPDPDDGSPVGMLDLEDAVYRKNPGLVISNRSSTEVRSSRRVRRLIETPDELTVTERMYGGRWQDDVAEDSINGALRDHQNRHLLFDKCSGNQNLHFTKASKKLEFDLELACDVGDSEVSLQLEIASKESGNKKPKDAVIYHEWKFGGGGVEANYNWNNKQFNGGGYLKMVGELGDEECCCLGLCAGIKSEIEFKFGLRTVWKESCEDWTYYSWFRVCTRTGNSRRVYEIYAAAQWQVRACAAACAAAYGSGEVVLPLDPQNPDSTGFGFGSNKMVQHIQFNGEIGIKCSLGPLDVSWTKEGSAHWWL